MKAILAGVAAALVLAGLASGARPAPPVTLSAVVNVDGSLARGIGAVSSNQNGVDGQYQVMFNRDVAGCAYVASNGEATALGPDDGVTMSVAPDAANIDGVFVQEYDTVLARDSYSDGFHLMVVC